MCSEADSFDIGALALQAMGAFVALVGIAITVGGLIGLKYYGATGSVRECNKSWRWCASVIGWCVGQLLQLCAVKLATEPVIAAVSTLAVPANALLAWRFLGEPVTRMERLAILVMTIGAVMVVFSSPQQAQTEMTVSEVGALFTASPLAIGGVAVTAAAGCAAGLAVRWPGQRQGSPEESMGFGVLAGVSGATSITAAKLCWMLFDETVDGPTGENETAGGPRWENEFVSPWLYCIGTLSALGEAGMAVALFYGLARGESTMVVPAYYISMNVMGSLQGLLLFDMVRCFSPLTAPLFALGILLSCVTVGLMAAWRREPSSTERCTPLMEEVAAPSSSAAAASAQAPLPAGTGAAPGTGASPTATDSYMG